MCLKKKAALFFFFFFVRGSLASRVDGLLFCASVAKYRHSTSANGLYYGCGCRFRKRPNFARRPSKGTLCAAVVGPLAAAVVVVTCWLQMMTWLNLILNVQYLVPMMRHHERAQERFVYGVNCVALTQSATKSPPQTLSALKLVCAGYSIYLV